MQLTAGTRLGPYEILSPLGTGGMGEVYAARDTRLDRRVAIKISKEQFQSDSPRRREPLRPSTTRTSASCTTSARTTW